MTDIVFYHSRTPLAYLIDWFSGRRKKLLPDGSRAAVAHCGIRYRIGDQDLVTHAGGLEVQEIPDRHEEVLSIRVPWVPDAWAQEWGRAKWGTRYGWLDLLTYPLKNMFGRWNFKGYLCSELVVQFLSDAAKAHPVPDGWDWVMIQLMIHPNPSTITPKGLAWDLVSQVPKELR